MVSRQVEGEKKATRGDVFCRYAARDSVKMSRESESESPCPANPCGRCRLGRDRKWISVHSSSCPILDSLDWFRHVGRTWYSIHHGHYLRVSPPSAIFLGSKCFSSFKFPNRREITLRNDREDWKYRKIGDKIYDEIYIWIYI